MPVNTTIKIRKGTANDWIATNSILASGEPGYELDTGRFKIGNGSTPWNSLSYASIVSSGFIAATGINILIGPNGSDATISVSGIINNPANNRLLTSRDNTTTGIDAETNLTFDGTTLTVTGDVSANYYFGNFDGPIVYDCRNNTASTINKGTPVYISGHYANGKVDIAPADASNSGKMPALGLLGETLTTGQEGHVHMFGALSNIDTSAYNDPTDIGKTLFVASGGGLTLTRPTGENILIQNIARIARISSNNGRLLVLGPARTNDVPNSITAYKLNIDDIQIDNNTISNTQSQSSITLGTLGWISIAPYSSGQIYLDSDFIRVGDQDQDAIITSNGTGDLVLSTNYGNVYNDSGYIRIEDGLGGDIIIGSSGNLIFISSNNTNCGGIDNIIEGANNFIGNANSCAVSGTSVGNFIGGGTSHILNNSVYGFIGGGESNVISRNSVDYSCILGGKNNSVSGSYNSILGGQNNNDGSYNNVFILGSSITATQPDTTYTQNLISQSGSFTDLAVNGTGVSLSGHTHTSSDITNFNSAVSGLVSGIYQPLLTNPVIGTGIINHVAYWDATNNIAADSGQLFWDSTNNRLGIGTNSPAYALDVFGNVEFGTNGNVRILETGGANSRIVFSGAGSIDCASYFSIRNNAGTVDYMRVDSVGVGIGTSSPSSKLHVVGNANISDTLTSTSGNFTTLQVMRSGIFASGIRVDNGLIYGPNNNAYLQINRGGVDRIELVSVNATLQGSTQVTINGNNIFANGTLAFPKVGGTTTSTATQRQTNIISFFNGAWNGSGALDINNAITSKISTTENMVSRIAVEMNNGDGTNNRTERFSLLNNGRLGLGTTSPNALLHAYSTVSGSSVLNIEGTNGSLFSVVDNLSGTLMSVNNNAGLPIFEVFSDDRVIAGRYNQNDLVVSSGGNIGMGTATPSGKLHIVGNANISGVLTATSGTITTLYTIPTYVSPSALSSNQGNWNPGAGDIIRMSATTGVSISGIVLGNEYIRVLINIGSTNNITLKHEATSATSGNRIITSTGGDHIIPPTGTTTILYDTVSNRWRVL